jgi:hypothetical protein
MNKRHLNNLARLADFLENEITNKQFNIETFRQADGLGFCEFKSKSDCGTIGCALGWSPFAIPYVKEDFSLTRNWSLNSNEPEWVKTLDFWKYGLRVFGLDSHQSDDEEQGALWSYMFSEDWAKTKGASRKATIKRIRKVIENNGELTSKMRKYMNDTFESQQSFEADYEHGY